MKGYLSGLASAGLVLMCITARSANADKCSEFNLDRLQPTRVRYELLGTTNEAGLPIAKDRDGGLIQFNQGEREKKAVYSAGFDGKSVELDGGSDIDSDCEFETGEELGAPTRLVRIFKARPGQIITTLERPRVQIRLDAIPMARVRVSFDNVNYPKHVEVEWNPAVDSVLARTVVLSPGVWQVSGVADKVSVVSVEGETVDIIPGPPDFTRGSPQVAWNFSLDAGINGVGRTVRITIERLGNPSVRDVWREAEASPAAQLQPRLFSDSITDATAQLVTLLTEIAVERGRGKALALVKERIETILCQNTQLPARALDELFGPSTHRTVIPPQMFAETCGLVDRLRIEDIATFGSALEKTLRADIGRFVKAMTHAQVEQLSTALRNRGDPASRMTAVLADGLGKALALMIEEILTKRTLQFRDSQAVLLALGEDVMYSAEAANCKGLQCLPVVVIAVIADCSAHGCSPHEVTEHLLRPWEYYSDPFMTEFKDTEIAQRVRSIEPTIRRAVERGLELLHPNRNTTPAQTVRNIVDLTVALLEVDASVRAESDHSDLVSTLSIVTRQTEYIVDAFSSLQAADKADIQRLAVKLKTMAKTTVEERREIEDALKALALKYLTDVNAIPPTQGLQDFIHGKPHALQHLSETLVFSGALSDNERTKSLAEAFEQVFKEEKADKLKEVLKNILSERRLVDAFADTLIAIASEDSQRAQELANALRKPPFKEGPSAARLVDDFLKALQGKSDAGYQVLIDLLGALSIKDREGLANQLQDAVNGGARERTSFVNGFKAAFTFSEDTKLGVLAKLRDDLLTHHTPVNEFIKNIDAFVQFRSQVVGPLLAAARDPAVAAEFSNILVKLANSQRPDPQEVSRLALRVVRVGLTALDDPFTDENAVLSDQTKRLRMLLYMGSTVEEAWEGSRQTDYQPLVNGAIGLIDCTARAFGVDLDGISAARDATPCLPLATANPEIQKDLRALAIAAHRAGPFVGLFASLISQSDAGTTPDDKERLHAERKKALESLIDAATDRKHRDGQWVVSLGASLGGGVLTTVRSDPAAEKEESLTNMQSKVSIFQWTLPMGLNLERLPARKSADGCPIGLHIGFTLLDPIQFVSIREGGVSPIPDADLSRILSYGARLGVLLFSTDNPLEVSFDLRYSPGLNIENFRRTALLRVGITAGVYVPFFDFN